VATTEVHDARPVVTALHPSSGPSAGGFRVEVYGRELAFIDSDIKAFMGETACKDPRVLVGWEKFSVEVAPCPHCGLQRFNVLIMGQRSNFVDFLYTDECSGPTGSVDVRPALPPRFSAEENCTLCTTLVHLTIASQSDNLLFDGLLDTMQRVCGSVHLTNFTIPPKEQCREDFSIPCRILVEARGIRLATYVWSHWDELYYVGKLPLWACRDVQYCSPPIGAVPLPDELD
jgi:hypothetical protein